MLNQPERANKNMHCRIYQANFNEVMDLMFAKPLPEGERRYAPAEKYSLVFDGTVVANDLEDVFRIFNVEHPTGYTGRSLSVTDVVEVVDGRDSEFYICENTCFVKADFDAASCQGRN